LVELVEVLEYDGISGVLSEVEGFDFELEEEEEEGATFSCRLEEGIEGTGKEELSR